MPGLRHIFRALKHHVLEEMGEPGAPLSLVARAYVIIDGNRNDWHRMLFVQNDAQAVIEGELFDWCVWNLKSFLHVPARIETTLMIEELMYESLTRGKVK